VFYILGGLLRCQNTSAGDWRLRNDL